MKLGRVFMMLAVVCLVAAPVFAGENLEIDRTASDIIGGGGLYLHRDSLKPDIITYVWVYNDTQYGLEFYDRREASRIIKPGEKGLVWITGPHARRFHRLFIGSRPDTWAVEGVFQF